MDFLRNHVLSPDSDGHEFFTFLFFFNFRASWTSVKMLGEHRGRLNRHEAENFGACLPVKRDLISEQTGRRFRHGNRPS